MNKFFSGFLHAFNTYLKIEIFGGLILAILILGYVLVINNRSNFAPSAPKTVPTFQEEENQKY